jgi:hypothetical protein
MVGRNLLPGRKRTNENLRRHDREATRLRGGEGQGASHHFRFAHSLRNIRGAKRPPLFSVLTVLETWCHEAWLCQTQNAAHARRRGLIAALAHS